MNRRTHESPMDFEWQNQTAGDPTSPFYQVAQKGQQRRGFESPIKPPETSKPQSIFGSPTKQAATPFRNPSFRSFTTPQKPFDAEQFAEESGAESSPADTTADLDDTPEVPKVSKMAIFKDAKPIKEPIFGRYGREYTGHSPGRGVIRRGKFADTAAHRIMKRSRQDRDYYMGLETRRDSSDSTSGDGDRPRSREKNTKAEPGWIASFFNYINEKPSLPYTLSYYPQVLMNYFIVGIAMYLIYVVIVTVRADVNKASELEVSTVLAEMSACARDYVNNRCAPDVRVPAMEQTCDAWEACMNRDPQAVARARVSAHTFAKIINSFIEPLSVKTMIFIAMCFVLAIFVNNFGFGLMRAKVSHPPPPPAPVAPQYYGAPPNPAQTFHWPAAPQTPGRQMGDNPWATGTPFHALMPQQTPGQHNPNKENWN